MFNKSDTSIIFNDLNSRSIRKSMHKCMMSCEYCFLKNRI